MVRLTASHCRRTKLIQKLSRQPFQELWSASTNSNPLFRDSCPLQKDNQQSASIVVLRCFWTTQAISPMFTCTTTSQRMKRSTQNMHSNAWRNNTGCASSITIATMEGSLTKRLWMTFVWHIKQSPSVASARTTKTGWLKDAFETSPKMPAPPTACSQSMAQSHSCQPMASSHQACR